MATLQQNDRMPQPVAMRDFLCKIEPAALRDAMRVRRDPREAQKACQENRQCDERARDPD